MDHDQTIAELEKEVAGLRELVAEKENKLEVLKKGTECTLDRLSNEDISRYSRQIILEEVCVSGQLKMKNASILVVGAGGLGCPAALYLVSAGVGHIGVVDYDIVERNNLHRQILHTEDSVGLSKASSVKKSLKKINTNTKITAYNVHLTSGNAMEIIEQYDVVLDCTDNVATRYLLNDACVLAGKPLVSGSALKFEGQITVYNYKGGPCYRCIFPTPPPPETITNCGDGGVMGAVTGTIGSLQALEAIKIILSSGEILHSRLLLFNGKKCSFKNVRLRSKRDDCSVCSNQPIITRLIDYEQFCGMRATDKDFALHLLDDHERITVFDYKSTVEAGIPHLLIDVRSKIEYEMCSLPNSMNIPLPVILSDKCPEVIERIKKTTVPVLLLCRRGNDSQLAVKHLQEKLKGIVEPKDIVGGLHAWHFHVDNTFPIY